MSDSDRGKPELADVISIAKAAAPSPEYLQAVGKASEALGVAYTKLFTAMVNVAFTGEWKKRNDEYEEGEQILLALADFEGVADPQVQLLLRLCRDIESAAEHLAAFLPEREEESADDLDQEALDLFGDEHSYFSKLPAESESEEE